MVVSAGGWLFVCEVAVAASSQVEKTKAPPLNNWGVPLFTHTLRTTHNTPRAHSHTPHHTKQRTKKQTKNKQNKNPSLFFFARTVPDSAKNNESKLEVMIELWKFGLLNVSSNNESYKWTYKWNPRKESKKEKVVHIS